MIRAENYETLSNFVKVTAKILSVPFYPDTVYTVTMALALFCEIYSELLVENCVILYPICI